jgi:hypothetical protein
MDVDRLVEIRVLKKVNHSEWAALSFIIPKKDDTVRFINDRFHGAQQEDQEEAFPYPEHSRHATKPREGFIYNKCVNLQR